MNVPPRPVTPLLLGRAWRMLVIAQLPICRASGGHIRMHRRTLLPRYGFCCSAQLWSTIKRAGAAAHMPGILPCAYYTYPLLFSGKYTCTFSTLCFVLPLAFYFLKSITLAAAFSPLCW